MEVTRDPMFYEPWKLDRAVVGMDFDPHYTGGMPVDFPGDRCLTNTEFRLDDGALRTTVLQGDPVQVYVSARVNIEDFYHGTNHDADCSWIQPGRYVVDDVFDVPWDSLIYGTTITRRPGVGELLPGPRAGRATLPLPAAPDPGRRDPLAGPPRGRGTSPRRGR